jgi:hypothetical protein
MSVCRAKERTTYSVEGTEGRLATRGEGRCGEEAGRGLREKGHAWEKDGEQGAVFNMCGRLTASCEVGRAVFAVSHTVSAIRDSSVNRTFPSLMPSNCFYWPQVSTRRKRGTCTLKLKMSESESIGPAPEMTSVESPGSGHKRPYIHEYDTVFAAHCFGEDWLTLQRRGQLPPEDPVRQPRSHLSHKHPVAQYTGVSNVPFGLA